MKRKRVLVVGLGRFGTSLVEELWDADVDVLVVDRNQAAVDVVMMKTCAALVGDGSDTWVLDGIGAKDVDVAGVTFAEDVDAGILTVFELAQRKVPTIVARAANERQAAALRAVGASRAIVIEHEMGRRLAPELLTPSSVARIECGYPYRASARER